MPTSATNTCPRCGGQLVERNGKHGRFIGCSNFPACRYTESINSGGYIFGQMMLGAIFLAVICVGFLIWLGFQAIFR